MSAKTNDLRRRTRLYTPLKIEVGSSAQQLMPHRISPIGIPACIRNDMIQMAAYFRAQRRAFEPGHELDDWVQAEREIDDLLQREMLRSSRS